MRSAATQQLVLRIIGVAGAALFAFFLALTYHRPAWVEDFAASYIESQVAKKVEATIDNLGPPAGDSALSRYAADLYQKNEQTIGRFKDLLKEKAARQIVECIDQARALTLEQRRKLETWIEQGAVLTIGSLTLENSKLVTLIQSCYLAVVADLTRDIRIFAASNFIAFLLLLLVSFLKPDAVRELFVPAVLLTISTLTCAYLYVFEQNWLLTIVHGNYLGFAYAAYLGVAFLFLCDVWFNKARLTIKLMESLVSGVTVS